MEKKEHEVLKSEVENLVDLWGGLNVLRVWIEVIEEREGNK